ncbi:HepT-like ribonuclease domain-containing protein [Enterococcus casseliflavus]|jgi:uncharacterized protein with HEPN domain|uniref:HepT-like ribonuclease domain-containing protein n=1 Tax=Enterococcus casseliflavus TaxID=37734 RepID=UPI0014328268|nr:HepT-like ribonuclease domain-containing protein [Enterococcus casseliflavus]NKD30915.1 DUF86 domain-containing protein [Enterococcus casseliflavus]
MIGMKEQLALTKILTLIEQIDETVTRFGDGLSIFQSDVDFQNSVAFSLVQIGETVRNDLSSEFKEKYSSIRWDSYRVLRNSLAHEYSQMDFEYLWISTKNPMNELREYCQYILKENRN